MALTEDEATLQPPVKPAKKSRRATIIAIVAVAAVIGGALFWVFKHGRESTDDAQIDADVVLVPTRVDGVVKKVSFTENQRVKAGDVLAEIDDSTLAARVAQADAQLVRAKASADAADAMAILAERTAVGNKSAAKANLSGASVGERTESAQLAEGRAQQVSADAQVVQAKTDVERDRRLAATGAITKAALDQTETQFRLANANLDLAKARIETLQSSITEARSRIAEATARATQNDDVSSTVRQARAQADAAKADVKVAQATRDLAVLNLSYAKIVAPQDGVISKKAINVGQQISAGQAIGQLVTDARWVTANYKETQVEHMRVGQPVKLEIDAFSSAELHGTIESISSGTGSRFTLLPPDNASGNFTKVVQRVPVRIKLGDVPKDLALLAGMNVDATVDTRN